MDIHFRFARRASARSIRANPAPCQISPSDHVGSYQQDGDDDSQEPSAN